MNRYIIYGKRSTDKKFAPLNGRGFRVNKLENAKVYVRKEDADAMVEKKGKKGVEFEVRTIEFPTQQTNVRS